MKKGTVMRGMYLLGHGGLDQLEMREDIPMPKPGPSEVLVKVAAAAVNNTDINTREAWYSKADAAEADASWTGEPVTFPRIQGADACGRIVEVGSHVDESRLGERVIIEPCIWEYRGKQLDRPWYFGSECDGAFAEYTTVAARHAYPVNSPLSDIELASFPCSYSTAENLLTRAGVEASDQVLVTGASGGVGSAAVQLARARGASVIAVASATKEQALSEMGANAFVARGKDLIDALGRKRVSVVIDLVAGSSFPQLLEVLEPGGRYATAGGIGGPIVELDVRTLYLKDLRMFGCTVLDASVFGNLVRTIEKGAIKPLVSKVYPLAEIQTAQADFVKKRHVGKLVLRI